MVIPFRGPESRVHSRLTSRQTWLGWPRRWIGMLMRTTVPILSVFLLVAVALVAGDLPGNGATPERGTGMQEAGITGRASVIDGDTLEIHGQRIRLSGVDAPEAGQPCFHANDKPWRCGQIAALALADRIGHAPVSCRRTGTDPYGRMVAICRNGGEDLGEWMVAQGWAFAYRRYSDAYVADEDRARASGLGIWSSRLVKPWDWRQDQRVVQRNDANAGPGGCAIKGNINERGEKIYHVPGGRWHARTGIDESRGERWFCSEAEARTAGWRRARQ